ALFARHAVAQAGDDRKLKVFAARAVENDAMRVDQAKLGAISKKRDRRALADFHANTIRQDTLHVRGFDPTQLFERTAPRVERNSEKGVAGVANELLQHRIAADDVISGKFDLFGLEQRHLR